MASAIATACLRSIGSALARVVEFITTRMPKIPTLMMRMNMKMKL
jgi:hypothetical protein